MINKHERFHYVPIQGGLVHGEPAHRLPFDLSAIRVIGIVAICEIGAPLPSNTRPSINIKITQYLRMSDESLIRLDMDRGFTSIRYGAAEVVSWKRSAEDLIAEVLTLVQADADEPDSFPWAEYADVARLRGIAVDSESLRDLPYKVLLSDEVAALFEF